jgi:hypothetical protein
MTEPPEPHPEEPWDAWTRRVAADLAGLPEGGFETFTVHVDATTTPPGAPRRRRRRRAASSPPPAPDVFLQVRRLEGVLALECIGDPEFEGISTLSSDAVAALVSLGWERDDSSPDLMRVLPPEAVDEAAALLASSLRDVLGATAPSAVDRRHG